MVDSLIQQVYIATAIPDVTFETYRSPRNGKERCAAYSIQSFWVACVSCQHCASAVALPWLSAAGHPRLVQWVQLYASFLSAFLSFPQSVVCHLLLCLLLHDDDLGISCLEEPHVTPARMTYVSIKNLVHVLHLFVMQRIRFKVQLGPSSDHLETHRMIERMARVMGAGLEYHELQNIRVGTNRLLRHIGVYRTYVCHSIWSDMWL